MRNLLITLCFNGQGYHGWQVQPNGVTVQQRVQDAVEAVMACAPRSPDAAARMRACMR